QRVRVPGAFDEPDSGTGEVALDIQIIRGIAPKAQIISYEGDTSFGTFGRLVARAVAEAKAQIISISWGFCEKYYPADEREADEREFAAAFASGVTLMVGSGGWGAYDCRQRELR